MGLITASTDIVDIKKDEEKFRYSQLFFQDVANQINGNIEILKNLRLKSVSAVFTAANTNTTITHNLGFRPTGYITCGLSASMVVYDGSVQSTSSQITLKASATGTATLLIF